MGHLRLSLYVLRNLRELTAGTVYPMSRLDVNECMPLNAQLTNIEARGIGMSVIWGTPRVMPQPCLRSFRLGQITYDDHTYAVDVDLHGDPLTWLYASDFDKVTLEKIVQNDGEHEYDPAFYNPDAVAALAYIKALPPDTPIVLYWA